MMLQMPIPGGTELVVLLLVLVMNVLFLAIPAVIAILVYRWWRDSGDDEEVSRLRARVDELEAEIRDAGDDEAAAERDDDRVGDDR